MTTERRRRRRGHAAAGARVLVGGVSVSVLVGLIGAMARSERPTPAERPPVVAGAQAGATSSQSAATARPTLPGAPPVVSRPTTPPTTLSRGT
jgi:hypothetical protein